MKYIIKDFEDVFHPEFLEYMLNTQQDKKHIQQIMNRIAEYEKKYNLQFVNIPADGLIIFREL